MRRAVLERFREAHGEKRMALLHRKALQAILNKKSAAASNWRKALRGFLDHCIALDMIKIDPLAGIKLVSIKSNGHHRWEPEECGKFEAHHAIGTRARLAYELLLQVGQKPISRLLPRAVSHTLKGARPWISTVAFQPAPAKRNAINTVKRMDVPPVDINERRGERTMAKPSGTPHFFASFPAKQMSAEADARA